MGAWDNWRPVDKSHKYCTHCGLVTAGPQQDRHWPTVQGGAQAIQAADNERYYTVEEAEALGLEHNVSGGICKDCTNEMLDKWRAGRTGDPPTPGQITGS